MKKLLIYTTSTFVLLSTGCEKYLSTIPDQRASLTTPESVSELLVNAYPHANYMPTCEAMSDNVSENTEIAPSLSNLTAYKWEPVEATGIDWQINYWNACYEAIAVANQALETISQANDPQAYAAQKGEALLARAYAHFMLVNLWCKPYNKTTSESDPGIPYVLEPEKVVMKRYERKTVAYVYEHIEKDLLEGLPLINDASYKKPAFHFNKRAAYAFATRFYLFKQDYEKTIQYAEFVFPNNSRLSYLRDWVAYASYTTSVRTRLYNSSSEKTNLLLVEEISSWSFNYGSTYRFSVLPQTMYSLTLKSYNNLVGTDLAYVTVNSNGSIYVSKFFANFISPLNSNLGNYYLSLPLLTADEVVFNEAEAYAMQDQYTEALDLLNTILSKKIKSYNPATHNLTLQKVRSHYPGQDDRTAMVNAVLELKRIEFMHEGLRWFDILRKGITVVHPVADMSITGNFNTVLGPDDPRRQIQLPPLTVLAGLEPNPR
ncbi:RagB/SusD family nutrient uptake outer membrane protein [Pedobacter sp. BS3]|uniref:RagB/SusD family nutrient uptake outer membrane protein n=1 Tax=Pedobacter sp. BS3 TaxID=2567937 RepID=UPI00165A0CD1|nr:RagB/SusD family nutrient uptake outer membrane protein [Pedobacter sp. BS3]